MSKTTVMEPDLAFIRRLKADGGDTFKQCFQCATCSVVCALAPEEYPFPRKEMLWAQRGLKDRLLSDPDIWLCHQCQDCSRHCPRGANPGAVLAGLRRMAIQEYAYPRPLAKAFYGPRFLPLLFAIPVLILALVAGFMGTLRIPEGRIVFSQFFTYGMIDAVFLLTALWTVLCAVVGGMRMLRAFRQSDLLRKEPIPTFSQTLRALPAIFPEILKHSWFRDCSVNRFRFFSHSNILWGFLLLFLTTTSVAVGIHLFEKETPWSFAHPVKIMGNLGGVILVLGSGYALWRRISPSPNTGESTYPDWLFLGSVFLTGLSGLLTEGLRLVNLANWAYPMYFLHLTFVWYLFLSLPFSKFAHAMYRTLAILYARSAGKYFPRRR